MAASSRSWIVPAAGVLSGTGQVLAEQPLDTLKTRLQSTRFPAASSPLQLTITMVRTEGAGALLSGVTPRLLTYPIVKLSLFSLYEFFYARTHSTAAAGSCAGALNTAVSCPADVIKSQLQVTTQRSGVAAAAPASRMVLDLLRANGVGVLYRGLVPLVARDALGYAILYSVYFRGRKLRERHAWARAVPGWVLGGLAGTAFYGATLPIDRIKVMMQTQPGGRVRSISSCVGEIRRRGLAAFYRGAGPTLMRTFVGQAVGLTVYELSSAPMR